MSMNYELRRKCARGEDFIQYTSIEARVPTLARKMLHSITRADRYPMTVTVHDPEGNHYQSYHKDNLNGLVTTD